MTDASIRLHKHQAAVLFDTTHRTICNLGGLGSGKTLVNGLILMDRASWDVGQLHGLFANTITQLENGVLPEIFRLFDEAGVEYEYNHKPPKLWSEEWRANGIVVPPQPGNFRRILTLRSGLHVLCGTIYNKTFMQYRTLQFGCALVEEVTNGPTERAVSFVAERVRCGQRSICKAKHRHQLYLVGNAPEDSSHWIFDWLNRAEVAAERGLGREVTREPGTYPLLTAGVGNTILIQSSTWDNAEHLSEGYADNLAASYDKETAQRRLGGQLIRVTSGRAAESFSSKNIIPVSFDPARTVYVCLDWDLEPAIAALCHPLKRGEYPDEFFDEGREVIGVFGEYLSCDGISVRRLAENLVKGDRGSGLNYRNERLRGLPVNWEGLRGLKTRFVAFGDATGNMRSKTADNLDSIWKIVGNIFAQVPSGYVKNVAEFNPPPRARLHALNARFESATKAVSLFVDPRCEQFIADCEQVVWDESGVSLKKWGKRSGGTLYVRGHLLDAVGYMADRLFPLGIDIDPRASIPTFIRKERASSVPSFMNLPKGPIR